MKKNDDRKDITVPVCVTIISISIMAFFILGILGQLQGTIGDDQNWDNGFLNLDCEIEGEENILTFCIISGSIEWAEYEVRIDNSHQNSTRITSDGISTAGETKDFSHPEWNPIQGNEYDIMIVHIGDNRVVWENTITTR